MEEVVYTASYAEVKYLREYACGWLKCRGGWLKSAAVQDLFEQMGHIVDGRNAVCLLFDLSEMKAFSTNVERWILENWLPKMQAASLRYVFYLPSHDLFNRAAMEYVMHSALQYGLSIYRVHTTDEALRYIQARVKRG